MDADNFSIRHQLSRLIPHSFWSILLIVTGCVVVSTLLVFGRLHSEFASEAMRSTQTFKTQIDRLNSLLVLVLDAETSVRGYLLTDLNQAYLQPYESSERTIQGLLAAINGDFPEGSTDRSEFEMLIGLIDAKRQVLAKAVQEGRVTSVIPTGQSGMGKIYMDEIRGSITRLRERLEERNQHLVMETAKRLNDTQQTITILALGALGLIIALFAVQQRQAVLRARIAELLAHENDVLESTVVQRTQELSDLASYLTDAREAEKGRLAREMHDELGALLTAAKMDTSWLLRSLGKDISPDIQTRFRRLIDTIGSGITLKRRIIDDLRPPLLQGLGLVEALRAMTDDLGSEYSIKLKLPEQDIHCPEQQGLALFRIAQEAVTNIRKYAKARQLELGLEAGGGEIHLWIVDDGCGFDTTSPKLNRHGLAGMKHRVQMFGGRFTMASSPGSGTRIDARMPLLSAPPPPESIHHEPVA